MYYLSRNESEVVGNRQKSDLHSQTKVHQLIQFRTAALVQVSAAGVALVHQLSQGPYGVGAFGAAHALKLPHPRSFTVHVFGTLVQLEMRHWKTWRLCQHVRNPTPTDQSNVEFLRYRQKYYSLQTSNHYFNNKKGICQIHVSRNTF